MVRRWIQNTLGILALACAAPAACRVGHEPPSNHAPSNHDAGSDQSSGQGGVGGDGGETGSIVVGTSTTCTPGETRSCTNELGCTATDTCVSPGVWFNGQCGGVVCGARCPWSLAQGCAWTFPQSDADNSWVYARVGVAYLSEDGAISKLIDYVGAAGCDGLPEEALGWDYVLDDAGRPERVVLCPETCATLGPNASLSVSSFWCVD